MFYQNSSGSENIPDVGVRDHDGISNNHINQSLNASINNKIIQEPLHSNQQHSNSNILTSTSTSTSTSASSSSSTSTRNIRKKAHVKIIEQPASKALRFRYECEGRSAGSIPGINSTPENRTFPTIEIVGYKGRAVVVVSCVTKDPPYRPHPHNLVGKEGCRKGVCTLEIETETMTKVFSNLGIQCVKKKDIESALRAREEIRVDPFKTGFQHRSQPSKIDLNSVRLCFQVFLESDNKGKFTVPLPPVVSDPIYDKKAMSDLIICSLCSCSCSVTGGKEMILLCEKVTKDDISVRFFEESNGEVIWEGFGDFQHTDVHKQTAIKFKTPRYKTLEIDQPVKVNIQLRRPSDGVTSEPLPFDYLPLDSGRRSFWNLRNNGLSNKQPDLDIFQKILADVSELEKSLTPINNNNEEVLKEVIILDDSTPQTTESFQSNEEISNSTIRQQSIDEINSIVKDSSSIMEIEQQVPQLNEDDTEKGNQNLPVSNDKITEWIKTSEFDRKDSIITPQQSMSEEDKTLYDLLEQVAELDEIYTDHQITRETFKNTIANEMASFGTDNLRNISIDQMDCDEFFDDAATYTSLQRAFKNPIPMTDILPPTPPASQLAPEDTNYDPIEILINPPAPVIDVNTSLKRESVGKEEEKLPPLPPKRVKKQENIENKTNSNNVSTNTLDANNKNENLSRPQSQIIIMKTPDQSPPSKKLPPTPEAKNKKPGFFSKLFSRKKSKSDITVDENITLEVDNNIQISKEASPVHSKEPSLADFNAYDTNRLSTKTARSLRSNSPRKNKISKPVGRSVSSVSGKRPHLTADIIHIPLKGDRGDSSTNSLPMNEAYSNASTLTLNNNLDRRTVSALQLADLPLQEGNMELIAIADAQSLRNLCEGEFGVQLDPNVDLTEAEHFALYTSIPPQATASEFDETSCYYAPVDAGEILTPAQVAERLNALNQK